MSGAAAAAIWQRVERLFSKLQDSDDRRWFAEPVDHVALGLLNYPHIVKQPMDFSTIRKKLDTGQYDTPKAMSDDVELVFDNAMLFNLKSEPAHIDAAKLKHFWQDRFTHLQDEWQKKIGGGGGGANGSKGTAAGSTNKRKSTEPSAIKHIPLNDETRPKVVGLLTEIFASEFSTVFQSPVDPKEVPNYAEVIKKPMDLSELRIALWRKTYTDTAQADAAMQLIHDNALEFNCGTAPLATKIRKDAKALLKKWRDGLRAITEKEHHAIDAAATDSENDDDDDDTRSTISKASASRASSSKKKKTTSDKKPAAAAAAAASSASSASTTSSILLGVFNKFVASLKRPSLDLFEFPVPKADFPQYYIDIKRPICIDDIRETLKTSKTYDKNPQQFLNDVALIWANCRSFNAEGSAPVHQAAQCERMWEKIVASSKEIKVMMGGEVTENKKSTAASGGKEKGKSEVKSEKVKTEKGEKEKEKETKNESAKKKLAITKDTKGSTPPSTTSLTPTHATPPAAAAASPTPNLVPPPTPITASSDGRTFGQRCRRLLQRLSRDNDNVKIFENPVNEFDAPNYSRKIKTPMWLKLIQDKITSGKYETSHTDFARDVELIWKNCITFNTEKSDLGKMAIKLRQEFRTLYAAEFGVPSPGIQEEIAALEKLKAEAAGISIVAPSPKLKPTPTPPPAVVTATPPKPPAVKPEPIAVKVEPTVKAEPAPATASTAASAPPPLTTVAVAPSTSSGISIAPNPAFYTSELEAKLAQPIVTKNAIHVVSRISMSDTGGDFKHPVRVNDHIRDYPLIIKQPMDLGTLRANLTKSHYSTYKEFTNDLERIWSNAIQYNGPTHAVSQAAASLRAKSHKLILEMFKEVPPPEVVKGLPEVVTKKVRDMINTLVKSTTYGGTYQAPIELSMGEEYEKYRAKITRPMDLGKVLGNLAKNEYTNLDDFYADVRLTFQNAIVYHGTQHVYGLQARFLLNEFEWKVKDLEAFLMKNAGTAPVSGKKGATKSVIPSLSMLRKNTGESESGTTSVPATPAPATTPSNPDSMTDVDTPAPSGPPALTHSPSIVSVSAPSTMSSDDHARCLGVVQKLISDPRFSMFNVPVDPSIYAGFGAYFDVIDTPMDLGLVKRKLNLKCYSTTDEFVADVTRITQNVKKFYEDTNPNFSDAGSIIATAKLLQQVLEDSWKNWATVKHMKKLPPSNLAPPPAIPTPAPSHPPATAATASASSVQSASTTVAAVASAVASSSTQPLGTLPPHIVALATGPPPADPNSAEYHAYKAARKQWKKLRKEKKKRKREQAGQIDVAGESAPNSPNSQPDTNITVPIKIEPLPPNVVPSTASIASVPTPVKPATAPIHAPLHPPSTAALPPTPAPRPKIPKISASASPDIISPKKTATAPTALPQLKIKLKDPSASSSSSTPHAPIVSAAVPRKIIPQMKMLSLAQRKKAMELAKSKLEQVAPIKTQPQVELTSVSMDIDANSSVLPSSTPTGTATAFTATAPSPSASASASATSSSSSLPFTAVVPPPPSSGVRPLMHRAHSYLASMIAPERVGPDGRKQRDSKKKGPKTLTKKKAEKWRMHKLQCEKAQEQLNARAARRKAEHIDDLHERGQVLPIQPTLISPRSIPLYLAQGFQMDATNTLVRITHSTLPPTHLFIYPIEQHIILLARSGTSHEATVDLQVNESSMQRIVREDHDALDQWRGLKGVVDEAREMQLIRDDEEMTLFQHPLTASSAISQDLSYFAALSPRLNWNEEVACYTHAIEFAGITNIDEHEDNTNQMSDVSEDEKENGDSAAISSVSYETILEMGLHDSDSDDDEEDDAAAGHARPFFGVLSTRCSHDDCNITPMAGGRFYHRCAARPARHAMKKRRLTEAPLASHQPAITTSTPQAQLSCTGLVVWSLASSLAIQVNSASYGPTSFGGAFQFWTAIPTPTPASSSSSSSSSSSAMTDQDAALSADVEDDVFKQFQRMREINEHNRANRERQKQLYRMVLSMESPARRKMM